MSRRSTRCAARRIRSLWRSNWQGCPKRLPLGGAGAQRLRGACRGRCSRWPAPIDFSPHQNRHRRGDHWSPAFSSLPFFPFSSLRKKRTAAASEEACSIPLPPGRRKLHIRSLLLPSRKPTAALGRLSVPIRKGKRRPENLSDGSLDSPSTKGLALGARGVWNSANTQ